MSTTNLKSLYTKEMKTLKGDTERREEIERNLKASHDAHPIQQPFPEEEEEEEETVVFKRKKSERSERVVRARTVIDEHAEAESEQTQFAHQEHLQSKKEPEKVASPQAASSKRKRIKMKTKTGPHSKKLKESAKEANSEGNQHSSEEQQQQQQDEPKQDYELFMVPFTDKDSVPIDVQPVSMKAPEIVDWETVQVDRQVHHIITRKDGSQQTFPHLFRWFRYCSRSDIEDLFAVGIKKYGDTLAYPDVDLVTIALQILCHLFDREKVKLYDTEDHTVKKWTLYETCGVYAVAFSNGYYKFYLVDQTYMHSEKMMREMLKVKLTCDVQSEMGKDLIKQISDQLREAEESHKS
jgi:hypothetical protein